MSTIAELGDLKEGSLVIIDSEPCRVVSVEKSKPGKHGAAKARIVAIGIFDNVKRSLVGPVDTKVEVPIVDKRTGTVIALTPEYVQIMDSETYEVVDAPYPTDEKLRSKLAEGVEVEFWKVSGRVLINVVR